jgi:hypothetical protein
MRKAARLFALWFLLGEQYFILEALYRAAFKHGERAHIAMLAVGGLCCVAVGCINQIPRFYNAPVWIQASIGTAATLCIEFLSGYILNIRLGLGIWDYAGLPGNVAGQICIPFAVVWFLLMPFAIWLEDATRWGFGWDGKSYSITSIYRDLVTGR